MIFLAGPEDEGKRADVFVAEKGGLSRARAISLLDGGAVMIAGKPAKKSRRLAAGEAVEFEIPAAGQLFGVEPEDIPLDVVFEDEDIIVVNKRKGMVVHPAAGHADGTLVNALLAHCGEGGLSGINGVMRPGIVHRIDKDTSGLLVAAKNDRAHAGLAAQIKEHRCRREYKAILCGSPKEESFTVDAPIARSKKDRKKMAVGEGGRRAVTHFETLGRFSGYSLVRASLETGRTHQIRVHAAYIGHPVLGDAVYGGADRRFGAAGQTLHAYRLTFEHPTKGGELTFEAELPDYFVKILEILERSE